MGRLASDLRRAFAIEPRDQHLSGPQFAFALATLLASAALWGWVTRLWFVPAAIMSIELLSAWSTPHADERTLRRLARSFLMGGVWAAVGTLVFGSQG
jgi:hypothetical protein